MTFYKTTNNPQYDYDYAQINYDPQDYNQPEYKHYYQQNRHQDHPQQQYLPKISTSKPNKTVINSNKIILNVSETQYDVVLDVGENILKWKLNYQRDSRNWDIWWTDHAVPVQNLMRMQQHQKINHFPGMSNLSRKNLLAKNLQKMAQKFPQEYDFFPKTWLLPYDYQKLKNYMQQMKKISQNKTFIVKPEANSQGRGIYLTRSLAQIPQNEHCVVQKYLTYPLLFQGLKFDLRVYVLVAGCDPLRLYIYNQGLVRLATQPYKKPAQSNLTNMFMHLTNYAINKQHPNFIFNESEEDLSHGHKRSLAEFFQDLKKSGINSVKIWADIKDIIVKTMISGQAFLAHQYRVAQPHNLQNNMCFQVLGFDLMVSSKQQKVFLLEINYTPSFSCESPLDQLVKSNLIRDTLILMNINVVSKQAIIQKSRQIQQKRVFTGKTIKMDRQERARIVQLYQRQRDDYQLDHLGSYQRIFPSFRQNLQKKYNQMLKYSQQLYEGIPYGGISNGNSKKGIFVNKKNISQKKQKTQISIDSQNESEGQQTLQKKQRVSIHSNQRDLQYQHTGTINRSRGKTNNYPKNSANMTTYYQPPKHYNDNSTSNYPQYRERDQSLPSVYSKPTSQNNFQPSKSHLYDKGATMNHLIYQSFQSPQKSIQTSLTNKNYGSNYVGEQEDSHNLNEQNKFNLIPPPQSEDYTVFSRYARKNIMMT